MKQFMSDKLGEECGVFGVSAKGAAGITYNGLLSIQHRGQESAGIAALTGTRIEAIKAAGLVREIFSQDNLMPLVQSRLAIGHTRYSTSGKSDIVYAQPYVTEFLTGRIAVAHNGNITNAPEIKKQLEEHGINFQASCGSEVLSALIAFRIKNAKSVLDGVIEAARELKGAFSLVVLSCDNKIYAIRDRYGFRPLCVGESQDGAAVASESCAVEAVGFRFVRDVEPGEIIVIEDGKISQSLRFCDNAEHRLCIFEYVYFARPDSIIDKQSVYEARFKMGQALAKEHPVEADIVCGVPDSGMEAAYGFAAQSKIPLASGFVKNRYIGRSFIYPSQSEREYAVKVKLNPLRFNVKGKRVVLVDDSIVRGTTCALIIKSLRNAGAKEVHLRISSPPFLHSCHYGTDVDDEKKLIAQNLTIEQIRQKIGADSIGYVSLEGLKEACANCELSFCTGCFTGHKQKY